MPGNAGKRRPSASCLLLCSPLSPPAGSHLVQGLPCAPQLWTLIRFLQETSCTILRCWCWGVNSSTRGTEHLSVCAKGLLHSARAHVREEEVCIPEGTRAHIQGLCSWWPASERLNARPSGDHNHFNATSCLSGCPTRMVWCAIGDPWGLGAMPRPCIGRKLAINNQSVNVHFSWERRSWPSKCVA